MLKTFLLILLVGLTTLSAAAQEREPLVYQIKGVHENSDLNDKAIERYQKRASEWNDTGEVLKLFQPVKGKYRVIVFMATGYGLSFTDKKEIFHNILILKTDQKDEILDGLEYVIEWVEVPTASRLVRLTQKGVKLKKGLPLSELKFKSIEAGEPLNLNGVIDNLYNFRQIFDARDFMMGKAASK